MENFQNNNVDPASLPQVEKVEFRPVMRQYLIKLNIQTAISMLVMTVAALGFWFYTNSIFIFLALIFLVLYFAFRFWNNFKLQHTCGFALREKDILYKRGYIVSRTTVVPFNRIQHASISRDLLDKMLNISSLQVYTAGGSGSDISIPGLNPELALQLKESLATKLSTDEN